MATICSFPKKKGDIFNKEKIRNLIKPTVCSPIKAKFRTRTFTCGNIRFLTLPFITVLSEDFKNV